MAGGCCPGLVLFCEFSTSVLTWMEVELTITPAAQPALAQLSTGLFRMRAYLLACCCLFSQGCFCGFPNPAFSQLMCRNVGFSSLQAQALCTHWWYASSLNCGSSLKSFVPLLVSWIICSQRWPTLDLVTSLYITLGLWANLLLTIGLQRQ